MKKPVLEILNTATGKPTDGWAMTAGDVGRATAQFTKDEPSGEYVYQWIESPPGCVEWTDKTYNWKREFTIKQDGQFFVRCYDENGFHFDGKSVFVNLVE